MKLATVTVTESEEHFLLNAFSRVLSTLPPEARLFIVGDWPRSKHFKKVSFHFELVCSQPHFDQIQAKLLSELAGDSAQALFSDLSPPPKQGSIKRSGPQKFLVRLFTHTGNKYKVSLDPIKNGSLYDDMQARDFSINALYCDVRTKTFMYFGDHYQDFARRIIRTVRPPDQIFGCHVNLYFRLIEFAVRYKLDIAPEIGSHVVSLDPRRDIFLAAMHAQPNNLFSSVKKFFSKHYVSQMLELMDGLGLTEFFLLDFPHRGSFKPAFARLVPLLAQLEAALSAPLPPLMEEVYRAGRPKVFHMKTRVFLIALGMFGLDELYAHSFLKMFLYNGKDPSDDLKNLLVQMHLAVTDRPEPTPELAEARSVERTVRALKAVSVDKSQWGFLLVVPVLRKAHLLARVAPSWAKERSPEN